MATHVPIQRMKVDPLVHGRTRVRQETVREYRDLPPDALPPVAVFRDSAGDCWLADGFHRFYAWLGEGKSSVPAEVREGGRRDALLFACGANATHGLPRSGLDKRACAAALLLDPEFAQESDSWIAEACEVSRTLVREVRGECANPQEFARKQRERAEGRKRKLPERGEGGGARGEGETQRTEKTPSGEGTPEELARQALRRAGEAVKCAAGQALSAAGDAYPEARHPATRAALSAARHLLADATEEKGEGKRGRIEDPGARIERKTAEQLQTLTGNQLETLAGGHLRSQISDLKSRRNPLETLHWGRGEGREARDERKPLETLHHLLPPSILAPQSSPLPLERLLAARRSDHLDAPSIKPPTIEERIRAKKKERKKRQAARSSPSRPAKRPSGALGQPPPRGFG